MSSDPPHATNGVIIVARQPLSSKSPPTKVPEGRWRWLECTVEGLTVIGCYFPLNRPKLTYWAWFIDQAILRAHDACVLIGDFNTGKHYIDEDGATFHGAQYPATLESLGYVDAWRSLHPDGREYTWFSPKGNGFRLDYAWLSAPAARRLQFAAHDHGSRRRDVTDHAALIVELAACVADT